MADRSASQWPADSTGQEADRGSTGQLADSTTLSFLFRLLPLHFLVGASGFVLVSSCLLRENMFRSFDLILCDTESF